MKKNFFSFLVLIFLISWGICFGQFKDDPNIDRIPYNLLIQSRNFSPNSVMTVITNTQGFDNFYLGVDFAEPHISINPNNPLRYFTAYNTNATHYTINGLDWFTNNPVFGYTMMGDPVTAYDSLGNLFYENMYGNGTTVYGTKIIVSTNNGQSWLSPVNGNSGNDKNWISADQTGGPYANHVYGTMTPGYFIRSTDHGASFQQVWNFTTQTLPGMMSCVGPRLGPPDIPGGCVYVVTNSGNTFAPVYSFYISTDGGSSFTIMSSQIFAGYVGSNVGGRHSVQNMRTRPYPFIASDNSYGPYRGRLYVVYATNDPPGDGNKPSVWCRYSTDQGINWTSAVRINDDANPTASNHWMPSIWCEKQSGRLLVKWFDTRLCPTSDSADVYASYSTDGGVSFAQNQRITTATFKINCTTCGGGGTPAYEGDYDAITAFGRNGLMAWSDFRTGAFGSYTAYFPDYAMLASPASVSLTNGGNATVTVKVPAVKLYTDRVKFTYALDSLPTSGSLNISFLNGKDSITTYPDSVRLQISAVGSVNPRLYKLFVTGRGPGGIPAHSREIDLLVNMAYLNVGTNRDGICEFRVNNISYTTRQNLVFPLGTVVNVKAVSPITSGGTQYVYQNWSDAGDTTHNVTVNGNTYLTANYKIQFKLIVNSTYGTTFGGGVFYDSAASFIFGVGPRRVNVSGTWYQFIGWTGAGVGAYTSNDTSGLDSAVNWHMYTNSIVEIAHWSTTLGLNTIGSEIPAEFKLHNNYPNPFNPVTAIRFDVPKESSVKLKIFDVLGREVETIVSSALSPGYYEVKWDASRYMSGVYFYQLSVDDKPIAVKKMMLIK